MKITRITTTKQNKRTVSTLKIEEMLEKMKTDTRRDQVRGIRWRAQAALKQEVYSHLGEDSLLPDVLPCAVMGRTPDGSVEIKRFNGVVLLSVGNLYESSAVKEVKQAARMMPMTMLAITGSSGMSVKILVSIEPDGGKMPTTEEEMNFLLAEAYERAAAAYSAVLPRPVTGGEGSVSARFRWTLDKEPYYNPTPTPMRIMGTRMQPVPQIDTTEPPAPKEDDAKAAPGQETRQLIDFLSKRYVFRYNKIMGYTEYMKVASYGAWQPVDERSQNSLAMEARIAGLNVWDKDVRRFLCSRLIQDYDPVDSYLWNLRGRWDGKDHIRRLARTVPTDCKQWPDWFYTWFLGMVAQWMGRSKKYGNSVAPLLISRQGYNKSTFCRSLIPFDLQWGYNDSLVLTEKRQVLQAMSQFLLINLDEFNQIPKKVQEGFLKNVIQLASVKVKRPYARHVEEQQRYASFIATANMTDVLTDPSGNRRFIGIELTGPINIKKQIDYEQLYAQAVTAIYKGERYWFDPKETEEIMQNNRRFQQLPASMQYFHEFFEPAGESDGGTYMSPTAIYDHIRSRAGSRTQLGNLRQFGRLLANLEGLQRKRTNAGTVYLVRELK